MSHNIIFIVYEFRNLLTWRYNYEIDGLHSQAKMKKLLLSNTSFYTKTARYYTLNSRRMLLKFKNYDDQNFAAFLLSNYYNDILTIYAFYFCKLTWCNAESSCLIPVKHSLLSVAKRKPIPWIIQGMAID